MVDKYVDGGGWRKQTSDDNANEISGGELEVTVVHTK